jgi:hypothetical protein
MNHRHTQLYWTRTNKPRVEASWNVMAHGQKPFFVFRRNGRVHLNWRGRQFSRLLAAEVCASAVVMLDTPCSEVVWRVLATHSIRQFPLHFPSVRNRVPSHFNWSLQVSVLTDYLRLYTKLQKGRYATLSCNLSFQRLLKAQHFSSGTPLIIRSSKLYL